MSTRLLIGRGHCGVLAAATVALVWAARVQGAPQSCATEAASLSDQGVQALGDSHTGYRSCLSSDGRLIVFTATSPLVTGDNNGWDDVYLRDRELDTTELISLSTSGIIGQFRSDACDITPDGRTVTFNSYATNLVPSDLNNVLDVFVRDRWQGTTERVSVSSSLGEANADCHGGAISADGRFVVFWSDASSLISNDTNGTADIFLHDRMLSTTECISVDATGLPANLGSSNPVISADGRWVAFWSIATNIAPCTGPIQGNSYFLDRLTGSYECLNLTPSGTLGSSGAFATGLSADGRYVTFESSANDLVIGDTNDQPDIFVRDMVLGITTRVSVSSSGTQSNSTSERGRISANGRFVSFESFASTLVPGNPLGWDIFVHDFWLHTTALVSQSTSGTQSNSQCLRPSISPDGTCVAFDSEANNLIETGDTNGFTKDVMVRECSPTGPFIYCAAKMNSQGCVPAIQPFGIPSTTSGLPFDIGAVGVLNHKPGLLIYGTTGQTLIPFNGGFLCTAPPIKRTPAQISSGSLPPVLDCSGEYHFDFNAWIQSGHDPALVAGQSVWAQYWHRDPGFLPPDAIGLTDAIEFTIL